jgi:hypothetical protein
MAIRSLKTGSLSRSAQAGNTMIFPGSYESIATVTVGAGGASSITFSSIPATYSHLQIRGISRVGSAGSGAGTNDLLVQFNGVTTSTYSRHALYGTGSAAGVNGSGSNTSAYAARAVTPRSGITASVFGTFVIDILDYADTNKFKTIRSLAGMDSNDTNGIVALASGSSQSTSAVSSITLFDESSFSFVQYSQFALYGVK